MFSLFVETYPDFVEAIQSLKGNYRDSFNKMFEWGISSEKTVRDTFFYTYQRNFDLLIHDLIALKSSAEREKALDDFSLHIDSIRGSIDVYHRSLERVMAKNNENQEEKAYFRRIGEKMKKSLNQVKHYTHDRRREKRKEIPEDAKIALEHLNIIIENILSDFDEDLQKLKKGKEK